MVEEDGACLGQGLRWRGRGKIEGNGEGLYGEDCRGREDVEGEVEGAGVILLEGQDGGLKAEEWALCGHERVIIVQNKE